MLSQEDASACLEAAADELRRLSYEELAERESRDGDATENREVLVGGDRFYISTTIAKLGRLRKRIAVEMTLGSESARGWKDVPYVYFERSESGRLYSAHTKEWEITVLKALGYAFLGGVVITFVALLWHFLLRSQ